MSNRTPNDGLRALLREANWSGSRLAWAVNQAGTENGVSLHYSRVSVAQWLAGVHPRPPVPDLVAEVLSRRLERVITPEMAGFSSAKRPGGGAGQLADDAVARLTEVSLCQRGYAGGDSVYSLAALPAVPWDEASMAAPLPHSAPRRAGRIGSAEVEAAATMARLFADVDAASGAGRVRVALSSYLATTVAPWLNASTGARVRPALFSIAARLTYLCGFTCFDDELHGAAQHYYRTGLRLAVEAGDPTSYVITLRAMSVQAHHLGHHSHALQLAEAAAAGRGRVSPLTAAFLSGQLAVALAGTGHRHAALGSLGKAERQLAAAESSETIGAYHYGSLAHQRAAVLDCLGDRAGAIAALHESIRHRPPHERRSRVITLAYLAELQLSEGHLDQASSTLHRFLDDYPGIDSGRARTALANLRVRLRSYARNTTAVALLRRSSAV